MALRKVKVSSVLGRYSHATVTVGPDLPREGPRAGGKIEIAHGHEVDPYLSNDSPAPGGKLKFLHQRRQRVAINAQTDTLEYEYKRGRVSPPAYETGRYIDRLLEAATGRRSSIEFGERNRAQLSPLSLQHALAARIDAGRDAAFLKDAMAREIGAEKSRVVVRVIGDALSFRAVARLDALSLGKNREGARIGGKGRDCERAARRVAGLFREGLEELAQAWERKGRPV